MYEIFEKLLKEHGITAYRVAKETGVTTATLTSWKKGKYTPKPEKMQKIADYFGVSLSYLMTGKNEIKKESQLNQKDQKDIIVIIANTEQLLKQDGLTAHIFRHNYCTMLCYQIPKISIKRIAQLLGDKEKMVLEVYNHVVMEKEDAAGAVNDAINF